MHNDEAYMCPVCGYPKLTEPPYDHHGCASFDICPSCGTEFGYDDDANSHEELRSAWIDGGKLWFSKATLPPPNWDPDVQMQIAGFCSL
jgi:hypothetical protein